jgi:hypothetical protein
MKYLTLAITCSILAISTSAFAEEAKNNKDSYVRMSASAGCAMGSVGLLIVSKNTPHPAKSIAVCALAGIAAGGTAELLISENSPTEESIKAEDTQDEAKEYISGP